MSLNQVCGVAKNLRSASRKRKIFEPNLKLKLQDINHRLDSLFSKKTCEFEKNEPNGNVSQITGCLVYCNDVDLLIKKAQESREVFEDMHLKFGIDSGGGFMKFCLSIQTIDFEVQEKGITPRQKYTDGVAAKKFKDSGVNKIFLIGINYIYNK